MERSAKRKKEKERARDMPFVGLQRVWFTIETPRVSIKSRIKFRAQGQTEMGVGAWLVQELARLCVGCGVSGVWWRVTVRTCALCSKAKRVRGESDLVYLYEHCVATSDGLVV
jgi:hypothetical protein